MNKLGTIAFSIVMAIVGSIATMAFQDLMATCSSTHRSHLLRVAADGGR